ncbi:hypothetical protein KBC55_03365 [Patescibacteria group bacterium]|nr:hypothetical protein [Patescibacteria group bacterium]
MAHDRLFIPLTPNVTSQKAWRVLRVGFLFGVGALVGMLFFQALRHSEQISVTGYPDDLVTVRLFKTPRSLAFFSGTPGASTIFPDAPMTVLEALRQSESGISLFLSDGNVVGYLTDARVTSDNISQFGYVATNFEDHALISAPQYTPTATRSVRPRFLLKTRIDGEIVQAGVEKSLPIHFSDQSIIVRGLPLLQEAASTLTLPKNAEPLAAFTVEPELLSFMREVEVPLVYSNASFMVDHVIEHGFSAVLGQDLQGITLHISTAAGTITSTQAAAFGKEFVEIADVTHDEDDELLTLRPKSPGMVSVTAEKDLAFITASGEKSTLSLALSSETLAANNRLLEAGNIGAIEQELCGIRTSAYLRPRAFTKLLFPTGKLEAATITTLLNRAEAIVTKRATTTVCFFGVQDE